MPNGKIDEARLRQLYNYLALQPEVRATNFTDFQSSFTNEKERKKIHSFLKKKDPDFFSFQGFINKLGEPVPEREPVPPTVPQITQQIADVPTEDVTQPLDYKTLSAQPEPATSSIDVTTAVARRNIFKQMQTELMAGTVGTSTKRQIELLNQMLATEETGDIEGRQAIDTSFQNMQNIFAEPSSTKVANIQITESILEIQRQQEKNFLLGMGLFNLVEGKVEPKNPETLGKDLVKFYNNLGVSNLTKDESKIFPLVQELRGLETIGDRAKVIAQIKEIDPEWDQLMDPDDIEGRLKLFEIYKIKSNQFIQAKRDWDNFNSYIDKERGGITGETFSDPRAPIYRAIPLLAKLNPEADIGIFMQDRFNRSKAEFDAAKTAYLLNKDITGIERDRLWNSFEAFVESSPLAALIPEGINTDEDYVREATNIMAEAGIELTEKQKERIAPEFMDYVAEIGGGLAGIIPTLVLTKRLTLGAAKQVGLGRVITNLKTGGIIQKSQAFVMEAGLEETALQLAGFEPGVGAVFYGTNEALRGAGLRLKGKYGSILTPALDKIMAAAISGTAGMEASHAFQSAVETMFNDGDWNEFINRAGFADLGDATKRILAELTVGGMLGVPHLKRADINSYQIRVRNAAAELEQAGKSKDAALLIEFVDTIERSAQNNQKAINYMLAKSIKESAEQLPRDAKAEIIQRPIEEIPEVKPVERPPEVEVPEAEPFFSIEGKEVTREEFQSRLGTPEFISGIQRGEINVEVRNAPEVEAELVKIPGLKPPEVPPEEVPVVEKPEVAEIPKEPLVVKELAETEVGELTKRKFTEDQIKKISPESARQIIKEDIPIERVSVLSDGSVKVIPEEAKVKPEVKRFEVTEEEIEQFKTTDDKFTVVKKGNELDVINIKTGKSTNPENRIKAIEEYKTQLDRFTEGEVVKPTEGMSPEELNRLISEESKNPSEVASAYVDALETTQGVGRDVISDGIASSGIRFTRESFLRFSDINQLEGKRQIQLNYFTKELRQTIDVSAKEISGDIGVEVTPQNIVDFVLEFPNGPRQYLGQTNPIAEKLASRFRELTGIDLNTEFALNLRNKFFELSEKTPAEAEKLINEVFNIEEGRIDLEKLREKLETQPKEYLESVLPFRTITNENIINLKNLIDAKLGIKPEEVPVGEPPVAKPTERPAVQKPEISEAQRKTFTEAGISEKIIDQFSALDVADAGRIVNELRVVSEGGKSIDTLVGISKDIRRVFQGRKEIMDELIDITNDVRTARQEVIARKEEKKIEKAIKEVMTLDEQTKQAQKDFEKALKESRGKLTAGGVDVEVVTRLIRLAALHVKKGTRNVIQFGKAIGQKVTKELRDAWTFAVNAASGKQPAVKDVPFEKLTDIEREQYNNTLSDILKLDNTEGLKAELNNQAFAFEFASKHNRDRSQEFKNIAGAFKNLSSIIGPEKEFSKIADLLNLRLGRIKAGKLVEEGRREEIFKGNPSAEKVETVFKKQRQDFEEATRSTTGEVFSRLKKGFITKVVDVSGNLRTKLLDAGATDAIIKKDLLAGSSKAAREEYLRSEKEIFTDITKNEEELLADLIQSESTIQIHRLEDAQKKPRTKRPGGVQLEEAQEHLDVLKANDPELFSRLQSKADIYFNKLQELLKRRLDEGIITEQLFDILKDNVRYSPSLYLKHLVEPSSTTGIGGAKISVSKSDIQRRAGGSEKSLFNDPRYLLKDAITRVNTLVAKNKASKALFDFAVKNPENGIVTKENPIRLTKETKQPVFGKVPNGMERISVVIKGQQKAMLMPRELAEEWIKREPAINQALANALRIGSGGFILRPMATGINPAFALSNVPRDIAHVLLVTDIYSPVFPIALKQITADIKTVLPDVVRRTGRYDDYIKEGGGMEFLTQQGGLTGLKLKDIPKTAFGRALKTTEFYVGYLNETSELLVRVAIRERVINKGLEKFKKEGIKPTEEQMTELRERATWEARNQLDFSQGGSWAKALDNVFPYLNASIQGTRTFFREAGRNPKIFAFKVAQIGGVATALYLYNMKQDGWDDISDATKAGNFIIMTPLWRKDDQGRKKHLYFKIPKSPDQRIITGMFEDLTHWTNTGELPRKKMVLELSQGTPAIPLIKDVPPVLSMKAAYQDNWDNFLDRQIWRGQKVENWAEFYKDTPQFYKDIGKALGLSPTRLETATGKITTMLRFNPIGVLALKSYDLIHDVLTEDETEELNKTILDHADDLAHPIYRRLIAFTTPGIVGESMERFSIEENTRRKLQNDTVLEFFTDIKGGEKTEGDFQRWIQEQPEVDRNRLENQFNLREKRQDVDYWWITLSHLQSPEVKAFVFYDRFKDRSKGEQTSMLEIMNKVGGINSDRFRDEVIKLSLGKLRIGVPSRRRRSLVRSR